MKKLLLIPIIALTGCANLPKCIEAAGKDGGACQFTVTTVYGTLIYSRANPGTNQISVGPTGITTKP